jgi:uncharacterized delta-60 repeat protein
VSRRRFLLPLLLLLPTAGAVLAANSLLDQPLTARINRIRSYAGDVVIDRQNRALVDGKYLLNTGDVADFVTRIEPTGEVELPFAVNAHRIFADNDVAPGIYALALDEEGRLLAAIGGPTADGTIAASEIIRMGPDGNRDPTFSTSGLFGAGNLVFALRPLKSGKILAAGRVLDAPKNASAYVLRLNANGSFDSTYRSLLRPRNIAGLAAYAIEPAGEGRYLIGKAPWRSQTIAEGNDEPRLSMIAENGEEVTAFGERARAAVKNGVYALKRQKDGRVVVGGEATLTRLMPDGGTDTYFKPPALVSDLPQHAMAVRAIVIQKDGRILIGGDFRTPNGTAGIARLLPDGQLDMEFMRNVGRGFESAGADHRGVSGIAVQADGRIVVAGSFETLNGQARRTLARLAPNGTPDDYPLIADVGLR